MNEPSTHASGKSPRWPWVVVLGIPCGCLAALVLLAGVVGGIVLAAFAGMKSSDVCEEALARARASPEVRAALGEPVEDRWWLSGNMEVNGPTGSADLSIPLRGSRGEGTLYVVAHKRAGRWEYEVLEVEVEGEEERIDLLQGGWTGPAERPEPGTSV